MKLLQVALGTLTLASSTVAASQPAALPFELTHLFNAHLNLGAAAKPITIQGGVLVVEPILNGTVAGPAMNATIYPGLALPAVTENQTLQTPIIELYGLTDDGVPFHLHEEGVGVPSAQMTRIVGSNNLDQRLLTCEQQIEIGGGAKYAKVRDGFILASVNPSKDRTYVRARAYLVTNTAEA